MIRIALLATSVLLAPASRALAPAAHPAPPGMPPRQQGARMTPDSVQVRVIELATSPVGARRYRLVVPAGDALTPRPLLLVLHGCTQDAVDFARGSRLDRAATERGWIVAYAEQPPAANPRRCWNWFLPAHQQRDAGEPALIEAIRADVARRHAVDPDRTWLVGVSAGAAMAGITALAYPEHYGAVAMHSGLAVLAARDAMQAVTQMQKGSTALDAAIDAARAQLRDGSAPSALVIHGDNDQVVRPVNAAQLVTQWRALTGAVADCRDDVHVWSNRVRHESFSAPGTARCRVSAWHDTALGHAWSGGDPSGSWTDPAAPDIVPPLLDWLAAHPRERAP